LVEVQGLPYPPTFEKNADMQYPSVELFIHQARRVNPNFSLNGQEYAVNRICQLVAGFPLGIELAANWVRLLSCEEIVERLERGGEILTTDLPELNPSLRSVLDSTWAMLTDEEQTVFRRLGDIETANEHLHNAAELLGGNYVFINNIRYYGVSSQSALQQGNLHAAKEFAQQAMAIISKVSPTSFYILEGYVGVSEVYLTAFENGKNSEDLKFAQRAVKALLEFGRVLPVGQPRAWLHQGLLYWVEGRQTQAFRVWEKSLALAEQLSLPYEAARAHDEIGRHLSLNDPTRQINLEKAIEIFSGLGAKLELMQAQNA